MVRGEIRRVRVCVLNLHRHNVYTMTSIQGAMRKPVQCVWTASSVYFILLIYPNAVWIIGHKVSVSARRTETTRGISNRWNLVEGLGLTGVERGKRKHRSI